MIIVPKGYDYANYQKDWVGTGHFMMQSYTPNVGATFVRNPHYWGTAALPEQIQWTFYAAEGPMTAALQANQIDCLDQFFVSDEPAAAERLVQHHQAEGLGAPRALDALRRRSVQVQVRPPGDGPLPRPSRAREGAVQGIRRHRQRQPVRTRSSPRRRRWPQRAQNFKLAKQLLAKAGYARGFKTPLYTEQRQEMPTLAQFVKAWAAEIGVTINLTIEPPNKYYGSELYGTSDWLDGEMSMVDYGARSTPNLFLEAPLQTHNAKTGVWCLERRPLQQPDLRQAVEAVRRRDGPFQPAGDRQADRDCSFSTRRRSSSRTSTTTWLLARRT